VKFLYAVKGCSHCDSREDCPKKLKNSMANLLDSPREVIEGVRIWITFCSDFFREFRGM